MYGAVAIRLAHREHRHDAHRIARPRDANGDLAAIRDQQSMKQRRWHACDAITSPITVATPDGSSIMWRPGAIVAVMGRSSADTLLRRIRKKMAVADVVAGPRLAASALRTFEKAHGIALPDGYARFLREVGNGAARAGGSLYALLRLGTVHKGSGVTRAALRTDLKKPFPHGREKRGDPQRPGTLGTTSWHGCLPVGGDGFYVWGLVVTGFERGTMWQLSPDGVVPNNPPRTFLEWYDYWLDGEPDGWWAGLDGAEEVHAPPDPLKSQRQALGAASAVLDGKRWKSAGALLDEVTEARLQGQVQFLRARLAARAKAPDAELLAVAAADSWLGPATETAVDQEVERTDMLALLALFDSEPAMARYAAVESAPLPEMYIPDGDEPF